MCEWSIRNKENHLSKDPLKVALVGCTGSELDMGILCSFYGRFPAFMAHEPVAFDLALKKDFLKDCGIYDAVVLHMIFRYRVDELNAFDRAYLPPDMHVSPLHSQTAWRSRLLAAQPSVIFVVGFNEYAEVCPAYLGELPGYKLTDYGNGESAYTR